MPYGDPGQQAKANEARRTRIIPPKKPEKPKGPRSTTVSSYTTGGAPRKLNITATPTKKKPSEPKRVTVSSYATGGAPRQLGPTAPSGAQRAAQRRAEGGYQHYSSTNKLSQAKRDEAKRNQSVSPSDVSTRAKNNENALWGYREKRKAAGNFKGKYYGPDVFKGDTAKLSKWRAAGSPKDKSKFA